MKEKTLFERIICREVPADIVYEDSDLIAFHDINPQAPFHVLVCPKKPIEMLSTSKSEDEQLLGRLMRLGAIVAEKAGYQNQFRAVINNGSEVGQTVFHLHLHVLAGRDFSWPPG